MTLDASLFVSDGPEQREVAFPDGSKQTLWFRQVSAGAFQRWREDLASDNADVRASARARLISAGLCEPDGQDAITMARAAKLKPRVSDILQQQVLDVCGFEAKGGDQKKESPEATSDGSGTS